MTHVIQKNHLHSYIMKLQKEENESEEVKVKLQRT